MTGTSVLKELNNNKTSQQTEISARVLKENTEYFAEFIYSQFNVSINSSKFPLSFELANISVFKNESRHHKNNCRSSV